MFCPVNEFKFKVKVSDLFAYTDIFLMSFNKNLRKSTPDNYS